ncbi:hypothetical protein [Flagellimonas profundi]|uniref:Uncharacterized protein n=1 Tax=Flagellimonas profundi TaxID=2915620 RepID=A0ABS3FBZ2_9FLAO|nr:hypothetical protein [Allomuricauda profundi]MBO0340680.1 hypothetical protein [Allomuricauda profundi]
MVKHPLEQKITESRNHGGRTIYAVLCILFLVNLSFSQYGTKNLEIAYRTITRGSYQLLELNEDFIIFTKKSAGKTVDTLKMDGKKWKAIAETVETLKLKEFPYLVAPSDRRKHDGTAHAKLKVYFRGQLCESTGFDDGNPPETIKELVELVEELKPN